MCHSLPYDSRRRPSQISLARDCNVSSWSQWGNCSKNCTGGTQERHRNVTVTPFEGGASCPNLTDTQSCNQATNCCSWLSVSSYALNFRLAGASTNCTLSAWTSWSACTALCGLDWQTRYRTVTKAATGPGGSCGSLVQFISCPNLPCRPFTALSSCSYYGHPQRSPAWSLPGAISPSVMRHAEMPTERGIATSQCRIKTMERPARHSLTRSLVLLFRAVGRLIFHCCSYNSIAQDCVLSDWTPWSGCSVPCDGGQETRTRFVVIGADYGGQNCTGATWDNNTCNSQPCGTHSTLQAFLNSLVSGCLCHGDLGLLGALCWDVWDWHSNEDEDGA